MHENHFVAQKKCGFFSSVFKKNIPNNTTSTTPKESSNAYTFVFGIFLENLNFELKIFWNTLEQYFPVIHGYSQRQLTQNF